MWKDINMNLKIKDMDRKQYIFVIKELVSREIRRKYARSHLGIIWSVLNPLMYMAVMSMIFTTIFHRSIENYPIYYLTGMIFWQLFSGASNAAMTALVDNKTLLLKVKLPKQTFVLARVYTELTNFGYTCIAYVCMLLVFKVPLKWTAVLFPIAVLCTLLFSMGIGYVLSIAYVFFGDVKHLYSVLLTLWMYLSALFYPVSSTSQLIQDVIGVNPLYVFIYFARTVVIDGEIPGAVWWIKMFGWSLLMFVSGYMIFKHNENRVMQRI